MAAMAVEQVKQIVEDGHILGGEYLLDGPTETVTRDELIARLRGFEKPGTGGMNGAIAQVEASTETQYEVFENDRSNEPRSTHWQYKDYYIFEGTPNASGEQRLVFKYMMARNPILTNPDAALFGESTYDSRSDWHVNYFSAVDYPASAKKEQGPKGPRLRVTWRSSRRTAAAR